MRLCAPLLFLSQIRPGITPTVPVLVHSLQGPGSFQGAGDDILSGGSVPQLVEAGHFVTVHFTKTLFERFAANLTDAVIVFAWG